MIESEIDISEDLVRDLLREQHPDLAELPIREVAGGWGNQMWRLGNELAVRMQRMDTSPDLQLKERRWLPALASRLPLPIPVPVRDGAPSERFPKLWTVMTWVEGTPLEHGSITRGDHAAETLAGFLRALHVEAPADAPTASDFGTHPKDCTEGFEHFFQATAPVEGAAGAPAPPPLFRSPPAFGRRSVVRWASSLSRVRNSR
jgi:aminoglycoside phosphotransferase (APT) family kinase protein